MSERIKDPQREKESAIDSTDIFFPIDGLAGFNGGAVKAAQAELAGVLETTFHCSISSGFVDKDCAAIEL